MDWFKKHVDTVVVLGGILSSVIWMNVKFNKIDERFHHVDCKFSHFENNVDRQFYKLEKEIAIIKAVMIMKGIMPEALAKEHHEKLLEDEKSL